MVTDSRGRGAAEEIRMPGNTVKKTARRASATVASRRGDQDSAQLARLLTALNAMRDGNFRKRLPVTGEGLVAELTIAYNKIAERQQRVLSELSRVQRVAGRKGGTANTCSPAWARVGGHAASKPPTAWSRIWSVPPASSPAWWRPSRTAT